MKKKIYVASSWRNEFQPDVCALLRCEGFEVYDFRNPQKGDKGFHWSDIDVHWKTWSINVYKAALRDDRAEKGYRKDIDALRSSNALVLVLPCGRSAHLECGYAVGIGKPVIILIPDGTKLEPELMYRMADDICSEVLEVAASLRKCLGMDQPEVTA